MNLPACLRRIRAGKQATSATASGELLPSSPHPFHVSPARSGNRRKEDELCSRVRPVISPPTQYFNWVSLLLRVVLMLLVALLCQSTLAQVQDKPEAMPFNYLSVMQPLPGAGIKTGTATILTKIYHQSISCGFTNNSTTDIKYPLPDGYTRFRTAVGIDDTSNLNNWQFDFIVLGKDANGTERVLAGPKTIKPFSKPLEFNVDIRGITILTLRLKVNLGGNGLVIEGPGKAWWTEARLSKEGPQPPPSGPLKEMAEQLTKGLDTKTILLNRFVLNPVGFDDNIAQDIQDGLRTELGKINALDAHLYKKLVSDTQKPGWVPGDDLDEKTRAALRDDVDDRYLILGRISDREEERQIVAATYDLRTGKAVNEGRARIPKAKPPVPTTKITLVFKPNSHLNIKSFRWIVDGDRKEETTLGSLNSLDIEAPQDAKTIKLGLEWHADGYRNNKGVYDYKDVTVEEFEVDIQKNKDVELSARVTLPFIKGPDVRGSLEITARMNGRASRVKWH